YQELLPRSFPFLLRHDCGRLHGDMLCIVSFFAHCHHLLNLSQDDFLTPLAPKIFSALDRCATESPPGSGLGCHHYLRCSGKTGTACDELFSCATNHPITGSPDHQIFRPELLLRATSFSMCGS